MLRTSKGVPQQQHNEDRMRRARSWLDHSREIARKGKGARTEAEETALECEWFIFCGSPSMLLTGITWLETTLQREQNSMNFFAGYWSETKEVPS